MGQHVGLEAQHLGLVDLVDRGSGRPIEPVGTGIQARGQDHDLPKTGRAGGCVELVEEMRPRGLVIAR